MTRDPDRLRSPKPAPIQNFPLFVNLKLRGVPRGLELSTCARLILDAEPAQRDNIIVALEAFDYVYTACGYMMKADRLLWRIAELRTGQRLPLPL